MMEKILQHQQLTTQKHKNYLFHKIQDYRWVILATLLPAVLWGCKNRTFQRRSAKVMGQLLRFVGYTAFTYAKRQLSQARSIDYPLPD